MFRFMVSGHTNMAKDITLHGTAIPTAMAMLYGATALINVLVLTGY